MLGLLFIGIALTLGIGIRIAATAGAILYLMMWTVALPPENNPVIDDHILGAISLVVLAAFYAGDHLGPRQALGRQQDRRGQPRSPVVPDDNPTAPGRPARPGVVA